MFTGIIEEIGSITAVKPGLITVRTGLDGISVGDSVAVEGACLTARTISGSEISFDASPETVSRTTLKSLKRGDKVNLERATRADGRLGGHIMTGHVEAAGALKETKTAGNSVIMKFSAPAEVLKYAVPKGSIGVDGISLTVVEKADTWFSVSVIPHTVENTTLKFKKAGAGVNLEPDILAKYVENAVEAHKNSKLSKEFLKENGFL
jgi:riboflavin synthase